MTRLIVIVKHPNGKRLYVLHRRVHHGTWGCLAMAVGTWLAWWDRKDFKEWFFREVLR